MRRATGKPRGHRSPRKIDVTGKLTVASVSVVTLIRTDTTLDHSQKAEKVCPATCPMVLSNYRHRIRTIPLRTGGKNAKVNA